MAPCRQWVEGLPEPNGYLENLQRKGREILLKEGLPKKSDEAWRLTDLKRIKKLLTLPITKRTKDISSFYDNQWTKESKCGFRIVIDTDKSSYESINFPPGVELLSHKETQKHLGKTINQVCRKNDWSLALNESATDQVLALRVDGQEIPPLELIMPAQKDALIPTRVILIIEEKTKLELLQVALGSESSAHSHVLEIHLGNHAELNHGFLGLGGGAASCLVQIAVQQEPYSSYSLTSVQHGWSLSRLEPRIIQLGCQGNTTLKGLQISTKNQQIATHSLVHFKGPEGCLNQLQKAAANQDSHSIFNGMIEVPRTAQRTNATQLSRNLLLSKHARIDTKPELEIVADDVRCAHGATVSQLQEDELFYLRSRGIDASHATSLILQGYFQEILDCLPTAAKGWNILNRLLGIES